MRATTWPSSRPPGRGVFRGGRGHIEMPIERAYPLAEVRAAYRELAERHTRGKIVLLPGS